MALPELDPALCRFTLCFIVEPAPKERILMLHRRFEPHLGLWNGVGGRLEVGEAPRDGCLREVREETGLHLEQCTFGGIVSWGPPGAPPEGGMYVFIGRNPQGTPRPSREGELAWKEQAWVFDSPEVVSNVGIFLPPMLAGAALKEWRFHYLGERLIGHRERPLPAFARRVAHEMGV
ncbi:MAG TPA: NUDIX domain-containing protein [Limnochordia bacterium]